MNYPILNTIQGPEDIKKLKYEDLPRLAEETRRFLIETVSKTGGHLGAGLGAVELTIALHYALNSPQDKIVWDVSHQTYPHKIYTGRKEKMSTLRQFGGLSGFTDPSESPHDHFMVAHAGTAISQALGLAVARDYRQGKEKVVAVVGDGGLTSGLAFEGLNNAGHLKRNMLIILNDNKMSISQNVGAMSHYLNKIITNPLYNRIRRDIEMSLVRFPRLRKLTRQAMEGMKNFFVPGMLFEELGFRYFGPVNGHNVIDLVRTLEKVLKIEDLCLLHVITEKGKGYPYAERDPERFHGVHPFEPKTGEKLVGSADGNQARPKGLTYTEAFANALIELAREDSRIVAVTAAMPSGTGLLKFEKEFPNRFFDCGIAEQHAITFAGSLAKEGLRPVCAIYSTFLQRAQDQLIHDVALQRSGITLCIDRAGIAGADGPTHHGVFDISYLGHIPDSVIASPKNGAEMKRMLELSLSYPGVFAIRYPKSEIPERLIESERGDNRFGIGEGEILAFGEDLVILAFGNVIATALEVAERLEEEGVKATVANLRFAKPIDRRLLRELSSRSRYFFSIEDHVLTGGFGSKCLEVLSEEGIHDVRLKRFALPNQFVEHGTREFLLERYGLGRDKLVQAILEEIKFATFFPWSAPDGLRGNLKF